MINKNNTIVDFERLESAIEEEIKAKGSLKAPKPKKISLLSFQEGGPNTNQASLRQYYQLDEFLAHQEKAEDFVKFAYLHIFKRAADKKGLDSYSAKLEQSQDPLGVLIRLSLSAEGRKQGVIIKGLWPAWLAFKSQKIPFLSSIVSKFSQLGSHQKIQKLKNLPLLPDVGLWFGALIGFGRQNERSNRLSETAEQQASILRQYHKNAQKQQRQIEQQARLIENNRELLEKYEHQVANLTTQLASLTYDLRQLENQPRPVIQGTEVSAAQELVKESPAPATSSISSQKFDKFYLAFEDHFRGSEADIKSRQTVYLPHIEELHQARPIDQNSPILDIGCGRGEWLQLLKEQNYIAKGIDLNTTMVQKCQDKGLDVSQGDALEYLRGQTENSFAAVSGFHIIEHVPFAVLLDLFDECLRVLRPGGLIIFETPNPENVQVGSHTFYYDSTHKNPLPPGMMEFVAKHRGFNEVMIKRLSAFPKEMQLDEQDNPMAEQFNRFFYGSQDYAVMGKKA